MSTNSHYTQAASNSNQAENREPLVSDIASGERSATVVGGFLLGLVIILAVGFGPGIVHNAAHDTRHTMAFPCH